MNKSQRPNVLNEGAAGEDGRNGMLAGEASQPSQSKVEVAAALPRDDASAPDEIDVARAREYALLATLLTRTPDRRVPGEDSAGTLRPQPTGAPARPRPRGRRAPRPAG